MDFLSFENVLLELGTKFCLIATKVIRSAFASIDSVMMLLERRPRSDIRFVSAQGMLVPAKRRSVPTSTSPTESRSPSIWMTNLLVPNLYRALVCPSPDLINQPGDEGVLDVPPTAEIHSATATTPARHV
jgi:hypothetical protein